MRNNFPRKHRRGKKFLLQFVHSDCKHFCRRPGDEEHRAKLSCSRFRNKNCVDASVILGKDRYKDVCLIDCFNAHGIKVSYDRDGPLWALADGNPILEPHR